MKAAPLPISKAVVRLLAQVQAEAQTATLEALSAKDGIVVLQPLEAPEVDFWSHDYAEISDARGSKVKFFRRRYCPESWIGSDLEAEWHPSRWTVSFDLVDGQGNKWHREAGYHVADDFGNLVPVH